MILIDPRSGSGELLNPIRKRVNGQAELCQMECGDFAWTGCGPEGDVAVGVELKSISDFLSSARSGRLHEQLGKMSDVFDVAILLIYGLFRPSDEGIIETYGGSRVGWTPLAPVTKEQMKHGRSRKVLYQYSEYSKHLLSLELQRNVVCRRASSQIEAVWEIVDSYQWWQKPWEDHHSAEGNVKSQVGGIYHKATVSRLMAACLPGVGYGKAGKIASHFDTVEQWVNALPTELEQVEGIGKKLSLSIYGSLRRKE